MGNMSYCRFQNTLTDLLDCLDALDDLDGNLKELSGREQAAAKDLIRTCWSIAEIYGGERLDD